MYNLYTIPICPDCKALKVRLNESEIEFEERNILEDKWRLDGYRFGKLKAPFIVFVDENGFEQVLEDSQIEKILKKELL